MHWFGSFLVGGKQLFSRCEARIDKKTDREHCSIVWAACAVGADILDAIDRDNHLSDYDLSAWRYAHRRTARGRRAL